MLLRHQLPEIHVVESASDGADATVVVGPPPFAAEGLSDEVRATIEQAASVDHAFAGSPVLLPCKAAAGGRLVVASTGSLAHWTDDVRRYAETAGLAIARAIGGGARRPALHLAVHTDERFVQAPLLAALGALQAHWRHPQVASRREPPLVTLSVVRRDARSPNGKALRERIQAFETAIDLVRDLTAGDPEFMAPEPFAQACEAAFAASPVTAVVDRDVARIVRENPLLGAVARASLTVERHLPRIVRLDYDGGGDRHLFFAGKGVTYDTGGADLKVNGAMVGMSKDKGGAAGIAGFFAYLAQARPRLRATALLGLVRNSIGPECFVSDEIIVSRGGVPTVIGNTDAEGRMVLADLLAALRDEAAAASNPVLLTAATLTGHVGRAYGPYPAVMGNGAATAQGLQRRMQRAGERYGDPFEVSVIRREDYEMVATKGPNAPMPQCNNLPSVSTPRGHQFPFCFLERAAGLDRHDLGSERPVPFLHVDLSAAAVHKSGVLAGQPSGCPVLAWAATFVESPEASEPRPPSH